MKIREIREKRGLSQRELALKINCFPQALSRYESGLNEPNVDTLIKLSNALHVSIDELVGQKTDIINLETIDEDQSLIIKIVLRMNKEQLTYTKKFVQSMMTDM